MKATIALKKISLDPQAKIVDVLRHALTIAESLDLQEFKTWCKYELNGYEDTDNSFFPNYRWVDGTLHSMNIVSMKQQIIYNSGMSQPIKEGIIFFQEHLSKNRNTFEMILPTDTQKSIINLAKNTLKNSYIFQKIDRTEFEKVVDIVRTRVLEFAIELEKKGIMGEEWEFTNEEKKLTQNIHYHNLINNGNMSNHNDKSTISQKSTNTVSIVKGNFNSLASNFKSHGLEECDIQELKTILDTAPFPHSVKEYNTDIKEWMKKMIGKSIDGSWQIGISAAGTILASGIQNYFGLAS